MRPFTYQQVSTAAEAARAVARQPNAMFLAGGTTLVDLMKIDESFGKETALTTAGIRGR